MQGLSESTRQVASGPDAAGLALSGQPVCVLVHTPLRSATSPEEPVRSHGSSSRFLSYHVREHLRAPFTSWGGGGRPTESYVRASLSGR